MNEGREYLSAVQLAALTPWSVEAINKKVRRGELMRGMHYFQPNGPGSQLVFKWSAIVALIEGKDAGGVREPDALVRPGLTTKGRVLDVEKATQGLHRLLGRGA